MTGQDLPANFSLQLLLIRLLCGRGPLLRRLESDDLAALEPPGAEHASLRQRMVNYRSIDDLERKFESYRNARSSSSSRRPILWNQRSCGVSIS